MKRLTGREDYQWVWTSNSGIICGICVSITSDFQFKIQNTTKISVIIRPNSFFIVQTSGLDRIQFGERKVLYPSESYIINITNDKSQKVEYLGFKYENSTLFFDYSIKQKALAEMLLTLSHKDLTDLHQKIKLDLNK